MDALIKLVAGLAMLGLTVIGSGHANAQNLDPRLQGTSSGAIACMRDWARPECQPGRAAAHEEADPAPPPAPSGPAPSPQQALGAIGLVVVAVAAVFGIGSIVSSAVRLPPISQWPRR